MIRTKATADTSAIDGLIDLLEDQDKMIAEVGQRVYERHIPELLAKLSREPGKVKKPIEWTSDKQRIAVIIKYKEMGITEWQRGMDGERLSQQWEATMKIEGGVFTMTIQNRSSISKFVYGSLAKDKTAALRFKQKFHANTGWLDAQPEVQEGIRAMLDDFGREFKQEARTRVRAYTKGSRRR